MFKLPNLVPTIRSHSQEWTDYAEFLAIKYGKFSLTQIGKTQQMLSDEIEVNGIDDLSDKINDKIDEISIEINSRISNSNGNYPFYLEDNYSLIYDKSIDKNHIYKFLLLATRLNMKTSKIQNGLDGTQIFEHLSSLIAKSYFGDNSEVDIMGTSKSDVGGFRSKLNELVKKIGEGGTIHDNPKYKPQDDNLDVVLWKGFSDKRESKIIAFGQCKTGTTWSENLTELNCNVFCKTWFTRQPVLTPIRMFFCAQYFPNDLWFVRATQAGLVFDRFRILDYLPKELEQDLLSKIDKWCTGELEGIFLLESKD